MWFLLRPSVASSLVARRRRVLASVLWALVAVVAAAEPAPEPLPVGRSLGGPPPAPIDVPRPVLGIGADPVLGSPAAPVTLVEFIDYECPYCQKFARETLPRLKAQYVDTGQVRYVARDFPLARHSRARPAAIAAACAGEQDRFWAMHEALLTAPGQLAEAEIVAHADRLGLDRARWQACRARPDHEARLDAAVAEARALGVSGTPSFLVGGSRGAEAAGRLLQGDEDFAAFAKVLAEMGIDSPDR
jgi:protein-disulfide isomerase